jgi:hypothetical protein
MSDLNRLPADLPVPEDDGAAGHLTGLAAPSVEVETRDRRHAWRRTKVRVPTTTAATANARETPAPAARVPDA